MTVQKRGSFFPGKKVRDKTVEKVDSTYPLEDDLHFEANAWLSFFSCSWPFSSSLSSPSSPHPPPPDSCFLPDSWRRGGWRRQHIPYLWPNAHVHGRQATCFSVIVATCLWCLWKQRQYFFHPWLLPLCTMPNTWPWRAHNKQHDDANEGRKNSSPGSAVKNAVVS